MTITRRQATSTSLPCTPTPSGTRRPTCLIATSTVESTPSGRSSRPGRARSRRFGAEIADIADKGDCVIVSMILRGRVRGTGEQVEMPETHVWKFRDGKATEVREYRTLDAALEALGD